MLFQHISLVVDLIVVMDPAGHGRDTVGQAGTEEGALLNLYYDARVYEWNISTVRAIEAGIKSAYAEAALSGDAIEERLLAPLPGGHYSIWPQRDQ